MTVETTTALPANRRKSWRRNNSGYLAWQDEPRIFVDDYGAVADGTTDDTAAIDLAMDAAYALASATHKHIWLVFNGDKSYGVSRRAVGSQSRGGIYVRRGVNLDFNGCKLVLLASGVTSSNCDFITYKSPLHADKDGTATTNWTISGNVAAGDTNLTVSSSAGATVGDEVFVRLNDNAYDSAEAKQTYFAIVTDVPDATHITVDVPAPEACTVASTATANKKIHLLHEPIRGSVLRNVSLISPASGVANAEFGIRAQYLRDCLIENVIGEHVGAGVVGGGYNERLTIINPTILKCVAQSGASSKGRGVNFWNAKGITIINLHAKEFEGCATFVESYSQGIVFISPHIVNTYSGRSTSTAIFFDSQYSHTTYISPTIEGNGSALFEDGSSNGQYEVLGVLQLNTRSQVKGGVKLGRMRGSFRSNWITPYTSQARYSIKIWLSASETKTVTLPHGIYFRATVEASAVTGITEFYLRYNGTGGTNFASSLSAGAAVRISGAESYGSDYPFNNQTVHDVRIVTDGTLVAGTYVVVNVEYFRSAAADDGIHALIQSETAIPNAYTQTYSTADRTHANFTSADLSGITSSTTGSALAEPGAGYTQSELQQNFRRIQDQFNALRADVADLKQLANAVIDDLQLRGDLS